MGTYARGRGPVVAITAARKGGVNWTKDSQSNTLFLMILLLLGWVFRLSFALAQTFYWQASSLKNFLPLSSVHLSTSKERQDRFGGPYKLLPTD